VANKARPLQDDLASTPPSPSSKKPSVSEPN